jgi:organic hydroperoxide reductase OsmC/OhrA
MPKPTPADLVSVMTAACHDLYLKLSAEERTFVTTMHYDTRSELTAAKARERIRRPNIAALRIALPLLQQRKWLMAEAIKAVLLVPRD